MSCLFAREVTKGPSLQYFTMLFEETRRVETTWNSLHFCCSVNACVDHRIPTLEAGSHHLERSNLWIHCYVLVPRHDPNLQKIHSLGLHVEPTTHALTKHLFQGDSPIRFTAPEKQYDFCGMQYGSPKRIRLERAFLLGNGDLWVAVTIPGLLASWKRPSTIFPGKTAILQLWMKPTSILRIQLFGPHIFSPWLSHSNLSYGVFHSHGGTPMDGWFLPGKIPI